jgi:hypothetical protein
MWVINMCYYRMYYHYHGINNGNQFMLIDAKNKEEALTKFNETRVGFHRRYLDRIIEV